MPTHARSFISILLAALLAPAPSFAFQSPLSDESIREAYFLGQRHDGSFERLLTKYTSNRLDNLPDTVRSSRKIFRPVHR
jgi:hypothetical protein